MPMKPRYRGDNQTFSFDLTVESDGVETPIPDTALADFTYIKKNGNEVKLAGINIDSVKGRYRFTPDTTTFDEVGTHTFDIAIDYGNGIQTTFVKDTILIEDDVNKS